MESSQAWDSICSQFSEALSCLTARAIPASKEVSDSPGISRMSRLASAPTMVTFALRRSFWIRYSDFDPEFGLPPTNTFHLGLWFNSPQDIAGCGDPTKTTPFNGEHNAGPFAMISLPAQNGLGPLCTDPNDNTKPATCNPKGRRRRRADERTCSSVLHFREQLPAAQRLLRLKRFFYRLSVPRRRIFCQNPCQLPQGKQFG